LDVFIPTTILFHSIPDWFTITPMNLQDARNLIAFHYWARDRMLDAVESLSQEQYTRELGGSFGSVRDTVVHTLSGECVWLARWKGETPTRMLAPESYPDFASVSNAWLDHEANLRRFFEAIDEQGIQKVMPYRTLAGIESAAPLWQMLQHVVNHASYHRGQVTTLLRQLGAAPPKGTDLITFYRENP
jgi:uncharacterized damage-inducible protein DinB